MVENRYLSAEIGMQNGEQKQVQITRGLWVKSGVLASLGETDMSGESTKNGGIKVPVKKTAHLF